MSFDPSKALGHSVADKPVRTPVELENVTLTLRKTRWNRRDLLLYAVGIGAKAGELNNVYG
jgi:hypothetical protein